MQDYDATLGIFSEQNILTDRLREKFKEKYLDVLVFNDYKKVDLSKLSYLVINLLDDYKKIKDVKNIIDGLECKILIVLPLYVKYEEKFVIDSNISDILSFNNNVGVILTPELIGEAVKYDSSCLSHDLIMQSLTSERIKISNSSDLINTITVKHLIEKIVREMFSFGISGQALVLVGPRRGQKSFCVNCLGIKEENIISTKKDSRIAELNHTVSSKVEFSLNRAVSITRQTIKDSLELDSAKTSSILDVKETHVSKVISAKQDKKKTKRYLSLLAKILLVFVTFLIFPLLLIIGSGFLFYVSVSGLATNTTVAEKNINRSLNLVLLSQNMSFALPFYYDYSNILYKTEFLVKESIELSKIGNELASKIVGKDDYNLIVYSDNISAILDRIHTDIGFLQSDLNELNGFLGKKIQNYLVYKKFDISEYKKKIYLIRNLSSRMGTLLGMEKPMKYLVIFQNNMELRPTGGFIGSFALVSLDKGKLNEMVVNDVYSADGQLKGHVDPPEPIRQYLGEGGWMLRDSNWDPDFTESAKKAEWFLDKEINVPVDGVIAIDLNFIKKLLLITGPIKLADFDKTITSENLYSSTQSEVESNFFPGSIKKASFLTALSKQLLIELQQIKRDKYFALVKEIYSSLEARHIQVYMHDYNAQEALSDLNYAGKVDLSTDCGLRCVFDKYSLIDANLGVNKSNLFIKRDQELNVSIGKALIKHELLVNYQNSASQAVGNAGVYKNYARVLLPKEAVVVGVRLYNNDGSFEDLKYDRTDMENRQEVGYLVNVLPGDIKKVQIVWNLNSAVLNNGGEYKLLVRKQAGTESDMLKINIENKDFTLTRGVPSVYTTTLERDFSLRLFLK